VVGSGGAAGLRGSHKKRRKQRAHAEAAVHGLHPRGAAAAVEPKQQHVAAGIQEAHGDALQRRQARQCRHGVREGLQRGACRERCQRRNHEAVAARLQPVEQPAANDAAGDVAESARREDDG
jgi:hypothetical protein